VSGLLDPVTVRAFAESDRNFIRSSWLRSYRTLAQYVERELYFAVHHRLIDALLERSDCFVAASREDSDHVLAYAVGVPGVLHYAYTKSAYRRQGLARRLVDMTSTTAPASRLVLTHAAPADVAAKMVAAGWQIRPSLAFYMGGSDV
jgi:GNAT superfamily N-acetyltransferase